MIPLFWKRPRGFTGRFWREKRIWCLWECLPAEKPRWADFSPKPPEGNLPTATGVLKSDRTDILPILKELSDSGGRVIATGGGVILREENRRCLKRNGLLIYLERPLEELLCTSDRPLSKSPEALEKMYRERKPLYEGAADLRIPVGETPEQTVKRILKALEEREQ